MWRCLNNLFGYCAGKPQGEPKDESRWETDLGGKPRVYLYQIPTCKRDLRTCGLYLAFIEHYLEFSKKQGYTNEN